ncbi:MAG: hypothetical protein AAFN10_14250, partial [Bacteroidota bacterium]
DFRLIFTHQVFFAFVFGLHTGEEDLMRENQSEINAIAATLDKHRQEISNNNLQSVDYQQMLMNRESQLEEVGQQADAVSFLASNYQRIKQYREYALNTAVAP